MEMSEPLYLPAELIEKILLNLPVKSLLRFPTVLKAWRLTILSPDFAERYRGREMVVLRSYSEDKDLVCPLSTLSSSDNPIDRATAFIRPFKAESYCAASCGELCCVEFENSLILYNPSMRTYRKLPVPSAPVPIGSSIFGNSDSVFVYGMGYVSAAKDYKILKIHRAHYVTTELYSLKSDCWRKVRSNPKAPKRVVFLSSKCVVLSGTLHWLVQRVRYTEDVWDKFILTFDLSKEKYGELKLPKTTKFWSRWYMSGVRGKLHMCYRCPTRFCFWVMEDDGWRKGLVEFDYAHIYPLCYSRLQPFYFGDMTVAFTSSNNMGKIFEYKDGTLHERSFGRNGCAIINTGFTYIESFVSISTSTFATL